MRAHTFVVLTYLRTDSDCCFLCQPIAGGYVQAGYHEVVNTDQCKEAASAAISAGQSAWRISSTMFTTVNHDTILEPLGRFKGEPTVNKYPPMKAGQQVADELAKIGLANKETGGGSSVGSKL